jgi:hypothetical protein
MVARFCGAFIATTVPMGQARRRQVTLPQLALCTNFLALDGQGQSRLSSSDPLGSPAVAQ